MSDAFRISAGEHPNLARTLKGQLELRRNELIGQLMFSIDWPDFTKRRGMVAGLDEAIRHCEEAEQDLRGDR